MTEREPMDELEALAAADAAVEVPAPTPARRGERPGRRRGVVLQPRDLALLRALGEARYLTAQALEWLFYPNWRERYKTYLEQRKAQPALSFLPSPNVYRRIGALAGAVPPLVVRLDRLSEQARHATGRIRGVYALTEAGAEQVAEATGADLGALWYEDGRRRSAKNLEHSAEIGLFYGALRAALEHTGHQLEGWQTDERLAARGPAGGPNYDRVLVPGIREPIAVLPDATFTLEGQRFFVEIDRARTNMTSWAEKLRAFEAYRGRHQLRDRYGVADFVVLVVSPNETRQRRIAEEVLKVTRHAGDRYRFLLADRVHPTLIRPAWRVVTSFTWERQRVVDRMVEVPAQLRWSAVPLWQIPQQTV
ncbi:MAG TPA: replication-relaxation family protein [Roseiflexaceae bacterium]|nr:replication-relaxation family protein [Roseiflexaceae bacterium]